MRPELVAAKQRLEIIALDVDGHADALGRLGDDVDLETFEGAALALEFEGRVVRIGADIQHVLRRRLRRAPSEADDRGDR